MSLSSTQNDEADALRSTWRLMVHERQGAALNMAVDEAMMLSVVHCKSAPTLRLYQWEQPAVSLGRFQNIARTIDQDMTSGISLVRRLTGGRGILHGDDLTVSIACRCSDLHLRSDAGLASIYAVTTRVFREAFTIVGVETKQGHQRRIGSTDGDCFACVSLADLVHRGSGAKVMGSALHRLHDTVLMQASIPLRSPARASFMKQTALQVFHGHQVADNQCGLGELSVHSVSKAIETSLSQLLQVNLIPSDLSVAERNQASLLADTRYEQLEWSRTVRSIADLDLIDTRSAV